MSQCSNITGHSLVKHFLQSSQNLSHNSVFDINPVNFDTCSGTPTLAIFVVIVIVMVVIFIVNCFLASKHQTEDKHKLTPSERGREPKHGGDNV